MKPKQQIVGLPVYQPGKPIEEVKREYGLQNVIKLASNENPFGPSPRVEEAMEKEFSQLFLYPDGSSYALREALSNFYGLDGEQFIFGNGSDEIVQYISRAFLSPGTNTVMATPTFPRYQTNAVIDGADVIEVPLQQGEHNLQQMKKKVSDQTGVVWVCNPNNPSGNAIDHDSLHRFIRDLPQDVLIVLDEAYYEYVTSDDYPDSLALLKEHTNILILRTFSKIYGLAALRIGYGIGHPDVIDLLNRVREPFNTSRLAQAAAIAALDDQDYRRECYEKNRAGKQQFEEAFQALGLPYYPTEANFIMVDVQRPAGEVFEALLKKGIIVRSGEALGFPTKLRITIGSAAENERIIQVLTEMVQRVS